MVMDLKLAIRLVKGVWFMPLGCDIRQSKGASTIHKRGKVMLLSVAPLAE